MKTKSGKKAAGSMLEAGEGDGTESPEEKPKSIVRRAIDTVKRVVGSVIKTVTNFTKVHSKLSILIGTALVAYNAEDAVKYVKNRKPLADNIKHFKADLKGGNPNDKVGKDFTVGETIIKKGVVTRQEALDLADGVRHAYNKEGNKKLLGTAVGATLLAGGAAGSYQKHNEKKAAKEIARRERAAKRYAEEGI